MDATVWTVVGGALGSGLGFVAKAVLDSYSGYRDKVRAETWKIRANELEQRLSQFYWPLHMRLKHDDLIWETVYRHLRSGDQARRPEWVDQIPGEKRSVLALEIEQNILIENHKKTVEIIRASIHRANSDEEFEDILAKYIRHVDTYSSLRAAGIDANPRDVGEPFPDGLSTAVEARLRHYQDEYEKLLRQHNITDLSGRAARRKQNHVGRQHQTSD